MGKQRNRLQSQPGRRGKEIQPTTACAVVV
jgi:hypothetical protein